VNVSGNTVGALDSGVRRPGSVNLHGWAIDPDTVNAVPIHVYVDGVGAAIGTANVSRGDLERFMPGYGPAHGFDISVPVSGDHTVCAYGISTRGKPNTTLGCTRVSGAPRGALDQVGRPNGGSAIRARGWAFDPDTAGPINVHIYIDGVGFASTPANRNRPDIGSTFPQWGPNHGFDVTIGLISPGLHNVCAYGISVGGGPNTTLGCKLTQVTA
jgi:hypothetical protein